MTDASIEAVDWQDRREDLRAIRKSVFIEEQHVPKELEWDGLDPGCTHVLATARLTPQGQIGRMAVLREFRGRGIGSQLLAAVVEQARRAGHTEVFLHAQVSVIEFYERHGFVAEGENFMDAGIEHRTMRLSLGR